MKVLLDECIPQRFSRLLEGHDVLSVPEAGWAGVKNGELLERASKQFDVFVTVDRNIAFQSDPKLPIAVVIIRCSSNRFRDLEPFSPALLKLFETPLTKSLYHI